jgi:hypothetical protein
VPKAILRLAAVAVVVGILAATPAAADAMTVSIGDPQLSARVSITVPVTVSCTPFDPALTVVSEQVSVSAEQASGRDIARGYGSVYGSLTGGPSLPFSCDGSAQTLSVDVLAQPGGPPFHGGPAVLTASAGATAAMPCYPGSTNCFFNYTSQSASSGAVSKRL